MAEIHDHRVECNYRLRRLTLWQRLKGWWFLRKMRKNPELMEAINQKVWDKTYIANGCATTATTSADVPSVDRLVELAKEMKAAMPEDWVDVFVLTHNEFERVKRLVESAEPGRWPPAPPSSLMGIPVEVYLTKAECHGRALELTSKGKHVGVIEEEPTNETD